MNIGNYSSGVSYGWKRATVDVMPPHESGTFLNGAYVLGRRTGLDTRVIDVRVSLRAGEIRSIDLSAATPWAFTRGPLPPDPLAFFGQPSIADVPLQVVEVTPDGAGYLVRMVARVGRMLHVSLWVVWYPDQPGWSCGEVVVTASNPDVPDVTATVPPGFTIRFGGADVLVPGGSSTLLPAGTVLGDGQDRSFPFTLVWRNHLHTATDWSSAGAAAGLAICANGIAKLYPDGNPVPVPGSSPLAWTRQHWAGAIERLHNWAAGPLGVVERSGSSGSQEDQIWVGAECASGPPGLGSETIRYLVALGQSRRPCHHLETNGDLLRLAEHPQLRFWDGRAHWHTGVSPDQLGKSRGLTELDTHGWFGPDVEHWLGNTRAIAARMHDSPALQWQLGADARVYLLQWTVQPGLSTSQTYAARAVGWEGIGVVHLWRTLEDRALADQVVARWLARLDAILLPQLGVQDPWDVRIDDPRLGSGAWWLPWQQSVGAYGLDLAGAVFGRADARALALTAARRVLADAWKLEAGRWVCAAQMPVSGTDVPPVFDESFNSYGMPLAVAVVLRHEPNDEKARAIWAQVAPAGGSWIAPGVQ